MTDPVPSKDVVAMLREAARFSFQNERQMRLSTDWQAADEIERLRTALRGIQSCSTCEACRGAATLALGTAQPPGAGQ